MKKIFSVLLLSSLLVVFSGCQNQNGNSSKTQQATASQKIEEVQSHGDPYSKGPTYEPGSKGPTAPPPQAQAVTKNENIRLTLPLKTES